MREEKFLNALAFLDDSMIEAVNKRREQKRKRKMYVIRILAGAACMCIVFVGLLVGKRDFCRVENPKRNRGRSGINSL